MCPSRHVSTGARRFHAVGMDLAVHVSLSVVDDLMHVVFVQSFVGQQGVCEDAGILLDVGTDGSLQELLADALDDTGAHGAVSVRAMPLQQPHHSDLAHAASSLDDPCALGLVHVASLPADVGFIDFDVPAQLPTVVVLHGEADTVQHEPSRFLSDADSLSQLVRTDAVLSRRNEPGGNQPLVDATRAVFHDAADLHGELSAGVLFSALPDTTRLGEADGRTAASRTPNDTIRPTELDHL